MKTLTISLFTLAVASAGGAFAAASTAATTATNKAFAGHELASKAHVTLTDARAIAVKARPGTITDQELEKEGGGSGLRYSFDIKTASGHVYEVGVDASNGHLLENGSESAHPD